MKKKNWLVAGVLCIALGLTGCSGMVPGQQTRAIVEEMKNISQDERSFAAMQYTGIREQIKEQHEEGKTSTRYKLSLDRYDVFGVDTSKLELEEPKYDINKGDVEKYATSYMKKAQTAIEKYFNEEKDVELTKQDMTVTVKEVEGAWKAEISPSEINTIVTNIDQDINSKTREMAEASEGYLQLEAVENMRQQLREAISDESYIEEVYVEDITGSAKDGYKITLSYPDPSEVYTKAVESSYEKFQTKETLNTIAFDFESLTNEMQVDIQNAISTSDETLTVTYDDDPADFVKEVAEARNNIFNEHLERVNAEFITPEVEKPATGVLSGANSGQSVKVENTTTQLALFDDVYAAFYQISGTDLTEEGTLALTAYIRGGETLTVYLPVGNYKLVLTRGMTWYGEDVKFGPYGISDTSSTLIDIKYNYAYTLTL